NRLNTIHGGTLASLVDLGGSLAVASTGRYATGVSTDLNVTYLAPGGKPGDVLRGVATCDKIGRTLAYTTVTFTNSKGQLAARGSHTNNKVHIPPLLLGDCKRPHDRLQEKLDQELVQAATAKKPQETLTALI
ncbi:hypothetical protein E4U53_003705, partial [Claviceps sorghi]